MKLLSRIWLVALAWLIFTTVGNGSTITWKNGASGNWSDAANWHPGQVPGPSDTAVITAKGTYTVTLDTNASVGGLILGAGDGNTQTLLLDGQTFTLDGQATINTNGVIDLSSGIFFGETNSTGAIINGPLTCSGGALAGVLTLASNSVLNLYGPSNTFTGLVVFTNYGTVDWSNVDLLCPAMFIYNYGLWDAQTDNAFNTANSETVFDNYGTFRKDGGNGVTLFGTNAIFYNAGTLDAEIGGINFSNGDGGGFFNAATNASISLGNFTLAGDATFSGTGTVQGNLSGNNGIIHGGPVFDYGSLSGTLTVASNGVANLVGISGETPPIYFNALTLTNYGTVNWSRLGLEVQSDSEIDNYGLWDAQDNSTMNGILGAAMAIFNNYGTFRKSGGSLAGGDTLLYWDTTFNNFGTVDAEVGLLQIWNGINCSSGSVINTASNAVNNSDATLSGDVYFTGAGDFDGYLNGNNAVIHGMVPTDEIGLEGVLTLASNSVLYLAAVPEQLVSFDGTTFTNYGTVICTSSHLGGGLSPQIYNYGLWDITTNTYFFGANDGGGGITTFNNFGVVRKDGTPFSIATFDSATAFNNFGTLDDETGAIVLSYGYGGGIVNTTTNVGVGMGLGNFTVAGDMTFTGTGPVQGTFFGDNGVIHGSMILDYGSFSGTLTVASNAVANLVGILGETTPISFNALTLTNYGTVVWSNLNLEGESSPQIYNYGLWAAETDNTFYGGGGGGTTVFNNHGTLRKNGGFPGPPNLSYTLFDGAVTLTNSSLIDAQTGLLEFFGNCSLGGGTLNFAINGSSDYAEIDFLGAPLAGSLNANFNNGFSPAAGDSFLIINDEPETGTFMSLNLPHLPPPLSWQADYNSYGGDFFTLSIASASPQLSAAINVNGSSISLSWDGLLGQTYQVQCATNLAPTDWINLGNPIPGTNGPITVSDAFGASPQKFYRIELQ